MLTDEERQFYLEALDRSKGGGPESVGYGAAVNQLVRFDTFQWVLERATFDSPGLNYSMLDVGCGTGDLLAFLRDSGVGLPYEYRGVDAMPEMIDRFQERMTGTGDLNGLEIPQLSTVQGDIRLMKWLPNYDVVVSIAAFALKPPEWEMWQSLQYVQAHVRRMVAMTKKVCAVTLFSPWKNELKPTELVVDPGAVFSWAMTEFGRVELLHSYCPFDFMLVIWRNDGTWWTDWKQRHG